VSLTFDLNTPSVLTIVWGISSRFVHVTVVPAGTVNVCGPKLKLSILTCAEAGAEGSAFATVLRDNDKNSRIASIAGINPRAIRTFLFVMTFLLYKN
jgi:hypothetical protein